jgi:hypothetical protein
LRVIDGDTLELNDGRIIRLVNINSPEKNFFNSDLSMNFLRAFVNETLLLEPLEKDLYNRTLGRLYSPEYLNLEIVKLGLSSKAWVQESELSEFDEAEISAIKEERGIWIHSAYFSCFDSIIDPKKEVVQLENNCNITDTEGWTLKDESRKIFKFPKLNFKKINIHSGTGENNETDLFWKSSNIWNNDRDTLYLFDEEGRIVHHESYGY